MPRLISSGRRSVLRPVRRLTRVVLPWSMCPAVPTIMNCLLRHAPYHSWQAAALTVRIGAPAVHHARRGDAARVRTASGDLRKLRQPGDQTRQLAGRRGVVAELRIRVIAPAIRLPAGV